MADKMGRVPLDAINLCFFSSFCDEDGSNLVYSIDIEDAFDAHYQMTADEAKKLEGYLKAQRNADNLLSGLKAYRRTWIWGTG